jgi:hypothetical protein
MPTRHSLTEIELRAEGEEQLKTRIAEAELREREEIELKAKIAEVEYRQYLARNFGYTVRDAYVEWFSNSK